jgi:hypothetical protein
MGFRHHPALQYYNLNVKELRSVTPVQFFEEQEGGIFRWTPKLEAVMALCEAAAAPAPAPVAEAAPDEIAALKAQVADLTAQVAKLAPVPAPETPAGE